MGKTTTMRVSRYAHRLMKFVAAELDASMDESIIALAQELMKKTNPEKLKKLQEEYKR